MAASATSCRQPRGGRQRRRYHVTVLLLKPSQDVGEIDDVALDGQRPLGCSIGLDAVISEDGGAAAHGLAGGCIDRVEDVLGEEVQEGLRQHVPRQHVSHGVGSVALKGG